MLNNFSYWNFKMFDLICSLMIGTSVLWFAIAKPNSLFG